MAEDKAEHEGGEKSESLDSSNQVSLQEGGSFQMSENMDELRHSDQQSEESHDSDEGEDKESESEELEYDDEEWNRRASEFDESADYSGEDDDSQLEDMNLGDEFA